MKKYLRAYPMVVLLLPLVAAILVYDHWRPKAVEEAVARDVAFVIRSEAKPTEKCERFEAEVIAQKDSSNGEGRRAKGKWQAAKGAVYLYLLRDSANTMPGWGDTVVAHTTIEWDRRIGRAFAARYSLQPSEVGYQPSLQERLYRRLEAARLEGDELAIVGALTLGYKEDLDPEVKQRFQASGAAHVLAVSGLHTGVIYGLLLLIVTLGGRFKPLYEERWARWGISLLIIGVMWFYAWLTGMTPSVVRAVLMVSIVEIARMAYRRAVSINTIAAAAVLILLVRPADLWSVSFQLSFTATAAIVMTASSMERFLHRQVWKSKALNWVVGTIIVSLAAQIGTLPITMYNFGQVSSYFLLTNLIVLPLATILVPLGLVTMMLGGGWIGVVAGKVTSAVAWLLNHAVGWIESLPGSTVSAQIDGWMVAAYYALILLFYWTVVKKPQ